MKNAVQLAEGSRAAAEEASNSTQRTRRVQEMQKQMADLKADTAEILKAVAASRDRQNKMDEAAATVSRKALEVQRAAAAAQQAPSRHHTHGDCTTAGSC